MSDLTCVLYGKKLAGGIDTFGPFGFESCQACWYQHGIAGDIDHFAQLDDPDGLRDLAMYGRGDEMPMELLP